MYEIVCVLFELLFSIRGILKRCPMIIALDCPVSNVSNDYCSKNTLYCNTMYDKVCDVFELFYSDREILNTEVT